MADFKIYAGYRFVSKKPHACGDCRWEVLAVGADCKLKCETCGKILILPHDKAHSMIKHEEMQ